MVIIKSLQSYWRRRACRKLDELPSTKNEAVVRLGDGGSGEVVVEPRPKLKRMNVSKPAKVMGKLKEGYVDTMLMFAGDAGAAAKKGGGGGTMWDRRIPKERQASMKKGGGDFERKVTLHLYSTVIATR